MGKKKEEDAHPVFFLSQIKRLGRGKGGKRGGKAAPTSSDSRGKKKESH